MMQSEQNFLLFDEFSVENFDVLRKCLRFERSKASFVLIGPQINIISSAEE